MSAVDHKVKAESIVAGVIDAVNQVIKSGGTLRASEAAGFAAITSRELATAQVHATLYAAEQQRIANIIEFTSRPGYLTSPDTLALIEKGLGI